jgi:dolichol-phosphate mannosyltransferase
MPRVTVVVPTLNEAGNIDPLVARLSAAFGPGGDWEVLFVDDDSRDATAAEIERLSALFPTRVIVRKGERGLGTAVLRGIASTDAPIVVVMDADLSHPPEVAPALAAAVASGADVAIGSRYVPGGGTEGWSPLRLRLSRGATLLARGLTGARDPMAGFFAIRRSLLDGVPMKVEGYKILLEILARARPARVDEIPIQFAPRHAGESKVSFGTSIAYLKQLVRLYAVRPSAQVAAFIGMLLVFKVILGGLTELDSIEAYHWLYAQHPALGYYDHPGMIGWMIWLSMAIFGDSPSGVRMVTFLGSSLAIWLTFLAGRRLFDERAGRLAALLTGLIFATLKFGSMATPDAPLLLFWAATVWALSHALSGDRPAWWYAAGLFLGLAMLSKYTAIFLPAGLLIFLLLSPAHRGWLRRKEPYLAALLAALVFSPTIIWNAQHDWQSLAYQTVGRLEDRKPFNLNRAKTFALRQVWVMTPFVALWVWGSGLAALVKWRAARWPDRFLAALGMPMILAFSALTLERTVRGHWIAPGAATLFLLTAAVVTRGGRLGKWLIGGSLAVSAAAVVGGSVYLAAASPKGLDGWKRLSDEVRRFNSDFVLAQDYHIAGHMAYHLRPMPAVDFSAVGNPGKSFRNWWRGPEHAGQDAVVIYEKIEFSEAIELVRACFEKLDEPVEVTVDRFGGNRETFVLIRARSYRPPGSGAQPRPSGPP